MNIPQPHPQDEFLETLKHDQTRLSVYRLIGYIVAFDRHTIVLNSAFGMQIVYKRNIMTLQPFAQADTAPRPANAVKSRDVGVEEVRRPTPGRLTLRKAK